VKAGQKAPAFRLQDDAGEWVTLAGLKGTRVVLFFYPKDDTTGCTVEACEFRDLLPRFTSDGVAVFGISPDPVRSHAKFRAKYALPYPLLSDPDHAVCEAYGVWHEKLFWGRRYMGVVRSTFVIGADGKLEHEWRGVPHEGHAAEVSAWLRGEPAPVVTVPAKVPRRRQAARKK
jgi:peroxiredoxin Q/BCP